MWSIEAEPTTAVIGLIKAPAIFREAPDRLCDGQSVGKELVEPCSGSIQAPTMVCLLYCHGESPHEGHYRDAGKGG